MKLSKYFFWAKFEPVVGFVVFAVQLYFCLFCFVFLVIQLFSIGKITADVPILYVLALLMLQADFQAGQAAQAAGYVSGARAGGASARASTAAAVQAGGAAAAAAAGK